MERLHRQVFDEYEDARRRGVGHPYNPDRPWNLVWQKAAEESDFWDEELEKPGF